MMTEKLESGVSVVICCKNSEETIGDVLRSVLDQMADEIVVIDGNSTDETVSLAKKFTPLVFSDEGRGLGFARQLAVEKIRYEAVCIISPDDIVSSGFIEKASQELKQAGDSTAALLAKKKVEQPQTFWDKGQDQVYQTAQSFPIRVVGNPSIYRTKYLKQFAYDDSFSANEDTDLCERWALAGLSVDWLQSVSTAEIESRTFSEFCERYRWYGQGDFRFIQKWWDIDKGVAFRHLFHPFRTYMLKYAVHMLLRAKFKGALFTMLCGVNRYIGLWNELIVQRKRRSS